MPTNADVVSLQMEVVRKKLPDLFETTSTISGKIKQGAESQQISTRDHRIPLNLQNGGLYRTYDSDGGDMGRGSGMQSVHMVSTYFSTTLAFEITDLQMNATAKSTVAVAKVFGKTLANAMKEFQAYDDAAWHGDGTGVFATATVTSAPTGQLYTLDTAFATQLCRRGAEVHVFNSALDTKKTTGTGLTISKVDVGANQILLSSTVSGAAATDKIVFGGVGATPSWKHGLYYFASSATSGTTLGLNRATYPEIVSKTVAAGGALAASQGLYLLDQLTQDRDDLNNLMGIAHQRQRTAWYQLGMQISEWERGKSDKMLDLVPGTGGNGLEGFTWCGIPHTVDKHQNRTRIDWFDLKQWGRSILKPLDFHEVEGRRLFEIRGASGGVAAATVFYLEQHEDWYVIDPGKMGFISGLSIPSV